MIDPSQTISLRPANSADSWSIRRLVWQARINPLDLDWQRFIVACTPDGRVIGCGQVKFHSDGAKELASIAVYPAWQRQGHATAIIRRLLDENPGTLYLTCRSPLGPFYHRFDFRAIQEAQMPPYFRRVSRLVRWLNRFRGGQSGLLVMKLPRSNLPRAFDLPHSVIIANHPLGLSTRRNSLRVGSGSNQCIDCATVIKSRR